MFPGLSVNIFKIISSTLMFHWLVFRQGHSYRGTREKIAKLCVHVNKGRKTSWLRSTDHWMWGGGGGRQELLLKLPPTHSPPCHQVPERETYSSRPGSHPAHVGWPAPGAGRQDERGGLFGSPGFHGPHRNNARKGGAGSGQPSKALRWVNSGFPPCGWQSHPSSITRHSGWLVFVISIIRLITA